MIFPSKYEGNTPSSLAVDSEWRPRTSCCTKRNFGLYHASRLHPVFPLGNYVHKDQPLYISSLDNATCKVSWIEGLSKGEAQDITLI